MKRLTPRLAWLLALTLMFAMAPSTFANTISPGGTTTNLTTSSAGDLPTGVVLASITGTFAGKLTGSPSGTYTAKVVRNASGFLDFVYRFSNTGSKDLVDSVTMSNFDAFKTDVFWDFLLGPGIDDPDSASRTSGPGPSVVKFFFSPGNDGDDDDEGPGQSSVTLVIATNARNFQPGIFTFQDGDTSSVAAFQPAESPVPEPGSILLFGTGLSAAATTLRRRTKKVITNLHN